MPFEYKPHGLYAQPIDSDKCKASVPFGGRSVNFHQCQRKAKRDGWCTQHHPDSEAKRRAEADARYKARRDNLPLVRLGRCTKALAEMQVQRDELLALCETGLEELRVWHAGGDIAVATEMVLAEMETVIANAKGE